MRRSCLKVIAGSAIIVFTAALGPATAAAVANAAPAPSSASVKPDVGAIRAQFKAKDQQIFDLKQQLSDANTEIEQLKGQLTRLESAASAPAGQTGDAAAAQPGAAPAAQKPMSDVDKAKYITMQYILKRPMHCIASLSNNPGHITSIKITDVKNNGSSDYPYDVTAAVTCHYDKPLSDTDTTQTSVEHTVCQANPTTGKVILKGG